MLTLALAIQAAVGAVVGAVNADITQRPDYNAAGTTLAGYQSPHLISAVSRRPVPPTDADNAAQLAGLTMAGCFSPHLASARPERSAASVAEHVAEVVGMSLEGSLPATARSDVVTLVSHLRKSAPMVELLSYARKTTPTRRAVLA